MSVEAIFLPFNEKYLDEAASIHRQCLPMPWSKQLFEETIQDCGHIGLMALVDGVFIGFVLGRITQDEAEILTLAVSKNWQGKGIGSKLLRLLIEKLEKKDVRSMLLEVKASNDIALRMYRSFGFERIGQRANYYPPLIGHLRTADVLQKIFFKKSLVF